MPTDFASADWVDSIWAALRGNASLFTAGPTWAHGPIGFVVKAAPDKGLAEDVVLRLDVHEGEARDLRAINAETLRLVPTVIAGPYARWKPVLQGTGSIPDCILKGHLQLKGDLPLVVRHRPMWDAITAAAAGVTTTFPDDVPAGEAAPAGAR